VTCADRDDQRVVASPLARAQRDRLGVGVHARQCVDHQLRVDIGRDLSERIMMLVAFVEGRQHLVGADHELTVGGDQLQRDPVARQLAQGEHGLDGRRASAGDDDARA
jgi:hypothetical protein